MLLTDEQRRSLYEDGLISLPQGVPPDRVDAALRSINGSIGTHGMHPDHLTRFRAQSYCPELQREAPITDLLHRSGLWEIAESLIGKGKIAPVSSGQIALRFPRPDGSAVDPHPHIDGMHSPDNGVPKGTVANFTALVGVFLSDVPGPYAGNFTVWKGTHRRYEDYFRRHGPDALLHGMPEVELPEPEQVTARAGDAMICHYQLGHGIAGNASPHTRYAVFFRLSHVDHESLRWDCMTDIWREWSGMRDLASAGTAG